MKRLFSPGGFTLVELIVVFSVMAILSTAGIAAFVDFSRQQTVNTTAQEIRTILLKARSLAAAQVSRCPTGQTFGGYDVLFCPTIGSEPTCNPNIDYQLNLVCSASVVVSDGAKKLPVNVAITPGAHQIRFNPISGTVTVPAGDGVAGATSWTIQVAGFGKSAQPIIVFSTGVIQ